MNLPRLTWRLILAISLPAALAETLVNIYNVYVPLYLQGGGSSLTLANSSALRGFGLSAAVVGVWLIADNILGFFLQPLVGAWSDRLQTRLGRRLPLIMASMPLIVLGFALIPLCPVLLNSSVSVITFISRPFILLVIGCILFFAGYLPSRALFQTLRQETVESSDRTKLESWYFFLFGVLTTLALTAGGFLYRIYPPLLFWVVAGLYLLSIAYLFRTFREPKEIIIKAAEQEKNALNQLRLALFDKSSSRGSSFALFLISVLCFVAALSGTMTFGSSWLVSIGGLGESQAASIMGLATMGSTLVAVPAGYLASGILGRRMVYLLSQVIAVCAMLLALLVPWQNTIIFILFGLGFGGGLVTQLPLAAEYLRRPGAMGATVGIYDVTYIIGGALGSLITGWVVGFTSYASLFIITGAFLAMGIFCTILLKDRRSVVQSAPERM